MMMEREVAPSAKLRADEVKKPRGDGECKLRWWRCYDDGGDYYNGQDHGTQGLRAKEETKLLSSKVNPSGGPRGRRGACGSCNQ